MASRRVLSAATPSNSPYGAREVAASPDSRAARAAGSAGLWPVSGERGTASKRSQPYVGEALR